MKLTIKPIPEPPIPKLTIKTSADLSDATITSSSTGCASPIPKLTIKPILKPASCEQQEIPKMTIIKSSSVDDNHIPKLTIKTSKDTSKLEVTPKLSPKIDLHNNCEEKQTIPKLILKMGGNKIICSDVTSESSTGEMIDDAEQLTSEKSSPDCSDNAINDSLNDNESKMEEELNTILIEDNDSSAEDGDPKNDELPPLQLLACSNKTPLDIKTSTTILEEGPNSPRIILKINKTGSAEGKSHVEPIKVTIAEVLNTSHDIDEAKQVPYDADLSANEDEKNTVEEENEEESADPENTFLMKTNDIESSVQTKIYSETNQKRSLEIEDDDIVQPSKKIKVSEIIVDDGSVGLPVEEKLVSRPFQKDTTKDDVIELNAKLDKAEKLCIDIDLTLENDEQDFFPQRENHEKSLDPTDNDKSFNDSGSAIQIDSDNTDKTSESILVEKELNANPTPVLVQLESDLQNEDLPKVEKETEVVIKQEVELTPAKRGRGRPKKILKPNNNINSVQEDVIKSEDPQQIHISIEKVLIEESNHDMEDVAAEKPPIESIKTTPTSKGRGRGRGRAGKLVEIVKGGKVMQVKMDAGYEDDDSPTFSLYNRYATGRIRGRGRGKRGGGRTRRIMGDCESGTPEKNRMSNIFSTPDKKVRNLHQVHLKATIY